MTFHNNSIFWVDVYKIAPNPFQPRREFDQQKLNDLAESIRQYGVLQPLVVTQKEVHHEGGMQVEYELIAGERRLRASKLAGLTQIPVIVRNGQESDREKLELAIIENLQREDISPIERAQAFAQLVEKFNLKHGEIAQKVGKSREYVSNTIRLLQLPEDMRVSIMEGNMTEGHARPLLMLSDKPDEQRTLFKEILIKRMSVRDAEQISRRIAHEKVRKHERNYDRDIVELEERASETLGTRVRVEPREVGGKVLIDFMSDEDLRKILHVLNGSLQETVPSEFQTTNIESAPEDIQSSKAEEKKDDEDLYTITNFSL